ncbi:hypothetical protein SISSUDRAFT_1042618 [Sistotremastrum suecicum HHB10207 ss-3]|uniref:Uncharacterized protein n=1 Tax=Sistotremastrum suecicum HHB10207 ss-3 TaxID=1314776 RepID=A0A166GD63_9AGAM|nr:hypothetical protein SISSUDRAFT_1042618 [Sistotremastrum suecicum HHB10207 ss-3]
MFNTDLDLVRRSDRIRAGRGRHLNGFIHTCRGHGVLQGSLSIWRWPLSSWHTGARFCLTRTQEGYATVESHGKSSDPSVARFFAGEQTAASWLRKTSALYSGALRGRTLRHGDPSSCRERAGSIQCAAPACSKNMPTEENSIESVQPRFVAGASISIHFLISLLSWLTESDRHPPTHNAHLPANRWRQTG